MTGDWANWIDRLYAAGLGEEPWDEAVRPIKEAISSTCFGVALRAHREGTPIDELIVADLSAEALGSFPESDDPMAPYIIAQPSWAMVSPESLGIAASFRGTAYYNEWAAPNGLEQSLCGWAELTGEHLLAVGAHRRRAAGPFTRSETEIMERVMPHLARAVRLHVDRSERRELSELVDAQLVRRGCASVIVDGGLRVAWMSARTESFLEENTSVRLERRRLALADSAGNRQLRRAVDLAIGAGETTRLRSEALHIEVQPMRGFRCAVFITSGRRRSSPSMWLRESYGLTAAEATVSICLANGMTPDEIAESRSVSKGTVRSQLKQVFAKVGVRRQAELVSLVNRLPG